MELVYIELPDLKSSNKDSETAILEMVLQWLVSGDGDLKEIKLDNTKLHLK